MIPFTDPTFARILEKSKESQGLTMPPIIYQPIPKARTYLDNAVLLAMNSLQSDTFKQGYTNPQPVSNELIMRMYSDANRGLPVLLHQPTQYLSPALPIAPYTNPRAGLENTLTTTYRGF